MPSMIRERVRHAWNAFMNKDPTQTTRWMDYGESFFERPDRPRLSVRHERTIIASIYNRISLDVSSVEIQHVRLDENGRYLETIPSGLNECLSLEANLDQTGRSFIQDIVMSMFDEGVVAIVPVSTSENIFNSNSFDIYSLRTGKIKEWYPQNVRVEVYNELKGKKEELVLPKNKIAIVENPLYAVMNEPNSTLQRLIRKLNLLDVVDEQAGSGKLNLIVQLPYSVKTEGRRLMATSRRKDLEEQLVESKYGIAYMDATERITQINRPLENNLLNTIEFLTNLLHSQLGITTKILDGTASEEEMLNYHSRILEPILSAIRDEMKRKFLTKTARTQLQSIEFYKDPFKLVPVAQLANMADSFTRNEILTSNEFRQIIGMKPSSDPNADELRNKNLSISDKQIDMNMRNDWKNVSEPIDQITPEEYEERMRDFDKIDNDLNNLERMVG